MFRIKILSLTFVAFLAISPISVAQNPVKPPKVLLVTAHPDDDALFTVTVYKIAKLMGGKVDLALLTNGEGGYKYSIFGPQFYGLELTKEEIGREYLPAIRKKELMAGGAIMGIRNYYFLEQVDNEYTLDAQWILNDIWDTERAFSDLKRIVEKGEYDYIFTLLPTETTHGHHQASAVLALRVVDGMKESDRPTILGGTIYRKGEDRDFVFMGNPNFSETRVSERKVFTTDRTQTFGHENKLNFKIISSWVIAEHKSQGTMQMYMNYGDVEEYWFYDINKKSRFEDTKDLFEHLKGLAPK